MLANAGPGEKEQGMSEKRKALTLRQLRDLIDQQRPDALDKEVLFIGENFRELYAFRVPVIGHWEEGVLLYGERYGEEK